MNCLKLPVYAECIQLCTPCRWLYTQFTWKLSPDTGNRHRSSCHRTNTQRNILKMKLFVASNAPLKGRASAASDEEFWMIGSADCVCVCVVCVSHGIWTARAAASPQIRTTYFQRRKKPQRTLNTNLNGQFETVRVMLAHNARQSIGFGVIDIIVYAGKMYTRKANAAHVIRQRADEKRASYAIRNVYVVCVCVCSDPLVHVMTGPSISTFIDTRCIVAMRLWKCSRIAYNALARRNFCRSE